jgi:hypothetical protein
MVMTHKKARNVNDVVMNRTVCTNEPFKWMELNDGKRVACPVYANEHVATPVEAVAHAAPSRQQSGVSGHCLEEQVFLNTITRTPGCFYNECQGVSIKATETVGSRTPV